MEGAVDGSLSDGNPLVPLIVLCVDGGSEDVQDRSVESFDEAICLRSVWEYMNEVDVKEFA